MQIWSCTKLPCHTTGNLAVPLSVLSPQCVKVHTDLYKDMVVSCERVFGKVNDKLTGEIEFDTSYTVCLSKWQKVLIMYGDAVLFSHDHVCCESSKGAENM